MYLNYASHYPMPQHVKNTLIKENFEYYNPSDENSYGISLNFSLDICAKGILGSLHLSEEQYDIVFTSGATESNNIILNSFSEVYTTLVEHNSILSSNRRYHNLPNLHFLPIDSDGLVEEETDLGYIISLTEQFLLTDGTVPLVSVIYVNNETGNVNNIQHLREEAHKCGCLFHTDATQAITRADISYLDGCDFITISGHKFGALSGIGAIIYKKNCEKFLVPMLKGSQNHGLRGGTENVIGISSMLWALGAINNLTGPAFENVYNMRTDLWRDFTRELEYLGIEYVCNTLDVGTGIWSFTFPQCNAEMLTLSLYHKYNIQISTGSACSKGNPSHVLKTLGLDYDSTVRISFDMVLDKDLVRLAECIKSCIDLFEY